MSVDSDPDLVPLGFVDKLFDLKGRIAVVTGGASGLGRAIALGLGQAGASVAIIDIDGGRAEDTARAIKDGGGQALALSVDVTRKAEVLSAVSDVTSGLGVATILVNSAGSAFRCAAEDFPEEKYDFVLDLNLKGTYLCCQAFGRAMLGAGRGSIVNVSSIGAFVAYPLASAYQASKGGVLQLTRALALEWHDRGVRVNGIAPTLMDSPLTRAAGSTTSVTSDFIIGRMLQPRLGQPRDLIGAVIFLASDASEMVTGHTIMCDDGYTIV